MIPDLSSHPFGQFHEYLGVEVFAQQYIVQRLNEKMFRICSIATAARSTTDADDG